MSFKCNQPQLALAQKVERDTRKGGFNTGVHIVDACLEKPKGKSILFMSLTAEAKKDELMIAYPNREWLAYLQGKKEGNNWRVYDIVVPLQVTTCGSVDVDPDADIPKECVGTIHSHGASDHATSFSPLDKEFLIGNHFVSIVTTGKHMTASVKITVPCGHYGVIEGEVIIERKRIDLAGWIKKAIANIKDPPVKEVEHNYQQTSFDTYNNSIVFCEVCKKEVPFADADFLLLDGHLTYFCDKCAGYVQP
jgi:hypothetical protein